MSVASDILSHYQHVVESLTLTTGSKGVFDVSVDGALLYSKSQTGRHANPGEVLGLFTNAYAQGISRYADS